MKLTRREALKGLGAMSVAGAATAHAAPGKGPVLIQTPPGGVRLYPTWKSPKWWTTFQVPAGTWTYANVYSLGALPAGEYHPDGLEPGEEYYSPDGYTEFVNFLNTPRHGVYTRAQLQLTTPPLQNDQLLYGSRISAAIHCVEGHRKHDAVLALQVLIYNSVGDIRAIALPVTQDSNEFTLNSPATTRAAVGWVLSGLPPGFTGHPGDVIAINIGVSVNNTSGFLAYGVGFAVDATQEADIATLDTETLANTWVEFSAPLVFQGI